MILLYVKLCYCTWNCAAVKREIVLLFQMINDIVHILRPILNPIESSEESSDIDMSNLNDVSSTTNEIKDKVQKINKMFDDNKSPLPQFNIEKLTVETFDTWNILFKAKLSFYDLEFLLNDQTNETKSMPEFIRLNKLVNNNILINVQKDFLPFIKNETLASQSYKILREMCVGSDQLLFIKTFSKVNELMNRKDAKIEETINIIRELRSMFELAKSNNNQDLIWIAIFINSLPNNMTHLKSTLCNLEESSIETYFNKALKEKHLIIKSSNHNRPMQMFNVNTPHNAHFRHGCWHCGSNNHSRSNCPEYSKIIKRKQMNYSGGRNGTSSSNNNNHSRNGTNSDQRSYKPKYQNNHIEIRENSQKQTTDDDLQQQDDRAIPKQVNNGKPRFVNCALICNMSTKRNGLYLDSGATDTFINNLDQCINFRELKSEIYTASGESLPITNIVDKCILSSLNYEICLSDCVVCPNLTASFLSVPWLTKHGYKVLFSEKHADILFNDKLVMIGLLRDNGLYEILLKSSINSVNSIVQPKSNHDLMMYWHVRLGHLNISDLRIVLQRMNINVPNQLKIECIKCMKSKCKRKPFPNKEIRSNQILEVIHTDISGKINIPNRDNINYFILFMDDMSRMCFIYLFQSKTEVIEIFRSFKKMIELKTNKRIKVLKSDQGTEFKNHHFEEICQVEGMTQYFTAPRCPATNGDIERLNQTIEQLARVLLIDSELNISFFTYALMYAVHIKNRIPHRSLNGKIPIELFTDQKVNYSKLKRFGSRVIYLEDVDNTGKFKERGKDGIFIGIPYESAGYLIYSIEKKVVITRRHVYFVEEKENQLNCDLFEEFGDEETTDIVNNTLFNYDEQNCNEINDEVNQFNDNSTEFLPTVEKQPIENSSNGLSDSTDQQISIQDEPSDLFEINDVNQSSELLILNRKEKDKFLRDNPEVELKFCRPVRSNKRGKNSCYKVINTIQLPRNIKEANRSREQELWSNAMNSEINSLNEKKVFEKVPRPNKLVLPLNWVFRIKFNGDGTIDKYKARLVVLGNLQHKTKQNNYSPVMSDLSFRLLLSFGVKHKMFIHHLDVCTAYLNADIDEEVYVECPPGFDQDKGHVFKLNKCLYGLRSSALAWYNKIKGILIEIGLIKSKLDECVFYKRIDHKLLIIGVYVDDILLLSDDIDLLNEIKFEINSKVTLSDQDTISHFLGINIKYNRNDGVMLISQSDYIFQTLDHFSMSKCNPKYTPTPSGAELFKSIGTELTESGTYLSIVGRLIYLSTKSRPDITFITNRLCSFMNKPTDHHLNLAKHVLKYLKATINYSLVYKNTPFNSIIVNCDADYCNDINTSKSINGICAQLYGNTISWYSRQQQSVSQSTCESEIRSINDGVNEMIYLVEFVGELVDGSNLKRVILNDNTSAISTCLNGGDFYRNKHYRSTINHIRDNLNSNLFQLNHCPSVNMPADILTKSLTSRSIQNLLNIIRLI